MCVESCSVRACLRPSVNVVQGLCFDQGVQLAISIAQCAVRMVPADYFVGGSPAIACEKIIRGN